ncbi:hypothetical protein, partial [Acinetobacter baumannii]
MKGRGKLLGKLAETYHVAGRFHAARTTYVEAVTLERLLLADPAEPSIAPILGGRGARSYLRFMLDRAKTIGRTARWPLFI